MKPTILSATSDSTVLRELSSAVGDLFGVRNVARTELQRAAGSPGIVAVMIEPIDTADDCAAAIEIFEALRASQPAIRRLLLRHDRDLTAIVDSLHSGVVQSILYRPLIAGDLRSALHAGASLRAGDGHARFVASLAS